MFTLQWFLNLASFGGVAILSVPVWSLNFRRKQLHRHKVADREEHDTESFRAGGGRSSSIDTREMSRTGVLSTRPASWLDTCSSSAPLFSDSFFPTRELSVV